MGSLPNATGGHFKRTPFVRSHSSTGKTSSFFQKPRSKLARLLLFEKINYLRWICTAATFFFVLLLYQAFLPIISTVQNGAVGRRSLRGRLVEELEFGEGIRFVPSKLLDRFEKENKEETHLGIRLPGGRRRRRTRAAFIRPKLALVLIDLSIDSTQLQMVSIAVSLREIGYNIEVFGFKDGPVRSVWINAGFGISIVSESDNEKLGFTVDWLNYNGVIVIDLEGKPIISSLSKDPFKSLPIIWVVYDKSLATRLDQYISTNSTKIINDWKQAFHRATVVVFPTHFLAVMHSALDVGNCYVIPGYLNEAWKASNRLALSDDRRFNKSKDFVISIIGSQFSYSGSILEYGLILNYVAPILQDFSSSSQLKLGILSVNSTNAYDTSLEDLALKLGFLKDNFYRIVNDGNFSNFLGISDVVIYGSFLEEQHFPSILFEAMCMGKLVIAPDLAMIRKHMDDGQNGYIYPREDLGMLAQILTRVISNGKLSQLAQNVASTGKTLARNLMVFEVVEGYAFLLKNILRFPSEVANPKDPRELPSKLKEEWQWGLFENTTTRGPNTLESMEKKDSIVDKLEKKWRSSINTTNHKALDESFFSINWEEQRSKDIVNARKRLLDEELKGRTEQWHGTWEEVFRSVKKVERSKHEIHERDDRELERTAQPLCIYEPYFGEGTWAFLNHTSLYRGISLSNRGRRPSEDDIDASSNIPILRNGYYRDVLGEHGAFFSLAKRIDRIHKNAWIGFQSWRLAPRKASLTKKAEAMLVEAIESQKHGDTLYFWSRMDMDQRNPLRRDFWSFCDAINAGNCRFAVSRTLQKMYAMPSDWSSLPPMPAKDGNSWSVMHSWAMPTRSFLEFVMFSRMFVDALDSDMFDGHNQTGLCYLSLSKDRHCYSRVLELLINMWAYHSGRRMVYMNSETGAMEEHHVLNSRRGQMWIQWFSFSTLKSMDEDRAEESDLGHHGRRWLWPSTGEVFWQGVYERERNMRQKNKERRKQMNKEKVRRMKSRARQKTLGRYIKPNSDLNTTAAL